MNFSESLKKNTDFRKVYHGGHSKANKYLVIYIRKNGTDKNRVGISVSKKVGNSIVRHRLTRLIRESYRLNEEKVARGYDTVSYTHLDVYKRQVLQLLQSLLLFLLLQCLQQSLHLSD